MAVLKSLRGEKMTMPLLPVYSRLLRINIGALHLPTYVERAKRNASLFTPGKVLRPMLILAEAC